MLKFHFERSQNRMKQQADKKWFDKVLKVGDWVFLKLQPHKQVSIRQGKQNKLSPKNFVSLKVLERIGKVAYKFELPAHAQIHDVFHVSQLKLCKGTPLISQVSFLPSCDQSRLLAMESICHTPKMSQRK
ncbi:hypothetical protein Tco_0197973, partial [Tanacetum coccineum]